MKHEADALIQTERTTAEGMKERTQKETARRQNTKIETKPMKLKLKLKIEGSEKEEIKILFVAI
jgi:hypothetical protein